MRVCLLCGAHFLSLPEFGPEPGPRSSLGRLQEHAAAEHGIPKREGPRRRKRDGEDSGQYCLMLDIRDGQGWLGPLISGFGPNPFARAARAG